MHHVLVWVALGLLVWRQENKLKKVNAPISLPGSTIHSKPWLFVSSLCLLKVVWSGCRSALLVLLYIVSDSFASGSWVEALSSCNVSRAFDWIVFIVRKWKWQCNFGHCVVASCGAVDFISCSLGCSCWRRLELGNAVFGWQSGVV